jgi:hypothetical protein
MMDNKIFTVFVPTLYMDLSCSPGGGDYEEKDGYLDKSRAEEVLKGLEKELNEELGLSTTTDEEYRLTDRYKEWIDDLVDDERGHAEDTGNSVKDLTDEEVIKKFGLDTKVILSLREQDDEEGEDYEDDFRGYSLSGPPHWYLKEIKING